MYFHGLMPVFQHEEIDLKSFRMFTSQLIANGTWQTANTGQNLALRISFSFITANAPIIPGGRRGSTGRHVKFLGKSREISASFEYPGKMMA